MRDQCRSPARIKAGEFREDLYYRINVLSVAIPPLRERPDDIEWLAGRFAEALAHELGAELAGLSGHALEELRAHDWPGNVRELRNRIERAVSLAPGPWIMPGDLFPDRYRSRKRRPVWVRSRQLAMKPRSAKSNGRCVGVAVRSLRRQARLGSPGRPCGRRCGVMDRGIVSLTRAAPSCRNNRIVEAGRVHAPSRLHGNRMFEFPNMCRLDVRRSGCGRLVFQYACPSFRHLTHIRMLGTGLAKLLSPRRGVGGSP